MALDATDRVEVLKGVKEISAAMTRIEAERDLIRDTKKKIVDEQGLDKKALNRLVSRPITRVPSLTSPVRVERVRGTLHVKSSERQSNPCTTSS
jgi:hypothetical protein